MAIILEGPDAAGKSMLARMLTKQFGLVHITAAGAPKNELDLRIVCEQQLAHCDGRQFVLDRVSPISHPIYNQKYVNCNWLMDYLNKMTNHPNTVVVYCRPPTEALMRPEKHEWKDYDTEEHKQLVLDNQIIYTKRYDEVFRKIPHLSYDYTTLETDYTVELIAMLAASASNDLQLANLKKLYSKIC